MDLSGGLPIDPAHPHVLAVADPGGLVAESDEADNLASFRTFVIGAVAHGLEFTPGTPAWIGTMTDSLRNEGYDAAIPFDWSSTSSLPIPGMTILAGQRWPLPSRRPHSNCTPAGRGTSSTCI